jgi:hypothetical protein
MNPAVVKRCPPITYRQSLTAEANEMCCLIIQPQQLPHQSNFVFSSATLLNKNSHATNEPKRPQQSDAKLQSVLQPPDMKIEEPLRCCAVLRILLGLGKGLHSRQKAKTLDHNSVDEVVIGTPRLLVFGGDGFVVLPPLFEKTFQPQPE